MQRCSNNDIHVLLIFLHPYYYLKKLFNKKFIDYVVHVKLNVVRVNVILRDSSSIK